MEIVGKILIGFVAFQHLYILWMEMFAWETKGKKVFGSVIPDELFKPTKGLAANQGLYNGFLVAGLVWSLLITDDNWAKNIACFFLVCVFIAGLYGGFTASKRIFIFQSIPAALALIALFLKF